MDEPRSVIERSLSRVGSESYTLESFYRLRNRKRARQRLTAGIVGLAIAVTIAVTGSAILRSASDHRPADTRVTPILREGEVLQVVDENGPMARVVATDLETGDQRVLHRCDGLCGFIAEFSLSTDGGWVAWEEGCGGGCDSGYPGGLWVAGENGSEIQVTPLEPPPDGWIWAWSPAADQLAFVTGSSGFAELVLFDPSTGERTSVTTVEGISALSWSPDSTAIAIASPSSGVSIIDLATGRSTSIAPIGTVEDHDLSWSPDGTRLLVASRGRIIVVNADGSDQRVLVDHGASGTGAPAWSPDGTRIAYLGASGTADVWVIGADGSDATRVFRAECSSPCGGWATGPIWSPDGSRIAFWIYVAVPFNSQLVVNADGTGSPESVDDVVVDGWIQG